MAKTSLTCDRLREVLHYNLQTGTFTRIKGGSGKGASRGSIAGYDHGQGYIRISVDGEAYRAHRLAFLCVTGKWPAHEVDHINGIRSDNRWENLRELTGGENTHNQRKPHRNGSTGFLGVRAFEGKYRAAIGVNGARIHLGTFDTPQLAHAAYVAAKRELHSSCTI